MPVNDHTAMIALIIEKTVADPTQIPRLLANQRHSGANAGVDEEIVADAYLILAIIEETHMFGRHCLWQCDSEFIKVHCTIGSMIGHVREYGWLPTDAHEIAHHLRVPPQRLQEHFFMIADDVTKALTACRAQRYRAVNDGAGRRAAIHQVPQQDKRGLRGATRCIIRIDFGDQPFKQIVAPVDIADRIDALALRHACRSNWCRFFTTKQARESHEAHLVAAKGFAKCAAPHNFLPLALQPRSGYGRVMADTRTTLLAIGAAALGVALFSLMDAAMKHLGLLLGAYNAVLWRNIFGAGISGSLYAMSRPRRPAAPALRLHVKRGVVIAAMALLFFWAITVLPLAEAVALSFIAPLIALYLAAVMLGESIGKQAIFASLLGVTGVAVIMAGRFGGAEPWNDQAFLGALAVLGSAVLFAYNLILARQQAVLASPQEIVFLMTVVVSLTLAIAAPWLGVWPRSASWPMLAVAAALATISSLCMSWAYARAEAQRLIPIEYTAFIWAALCGWAFFDEPLGLPTIAGAVLIVTGCLIVARQHPQPMQGEEAVV